MLLPGENNPKFWLFITILVSTIIAYSESGGGKKLDIKIGFDLIQGSNGAPSIRIRDFKDSAEYNPRAVDDASSSDSGSKKTTPRESSESEEHEHERPKKEVESSKEKVKAQKSSGDSSDSEDGESNAKTEEKLRSTRGLKAADFEPEEENPKIHGRYQKHEASDNSDDDGRRRYKRHIGRFSYRKGKDV